LAMEEAKVEEGGGSNGVAALPPSEVTVVDVQEHSWQPASHPTALSTARLCSPIGRGAFEDASLLGKPVMHLTAEEAEEELAKLRQETKFVRFRVADINQHLICRLCNGYFRDAHTINECLHTFCKSCLFIRLHEGMKKCPAPGCQTDLSVTAEGLICADRQMQSIVDKLFPHLRVEDAENEAKFYRERNIAPKPEHGRAPTRVVVDTPRKRRRTKRDGSGKEMNVKLVPDETCPDSHKLRELEKPYLRTSSKLRMLQLQKYVEKKLELDTGGDLVSVELLCNGEVLGPEHSLEFVGRTRWIDEGPTLQLHYRKAGD